MLRLRTAKTMIIISAVTYLPATRKKLPHLKRIQCLRFHSTRLPHCRRTYGRSSDISTNFCQTALRHVSGYEYLLLYNLSFFVSYFSCLFLSCPSSCSPFSTPLALVSLSYSEDGDSNLLRYVDSHLPNYTASHPTRPDS